MLARCQCGQLKAAVEVDTDQIVACHCLACQRRSGSPFGVIAYFPAHDVTLSGEASEFTRETDSGNRFTTAFCPRCGTTVWCRAELKPNVIGIPVGTFGDNHFPAPVRSVWEQSMHPWVRLPAPIAHFPRGRS